MGSENDFATDDSGNEANNLEPPHTPTDEEIIKAISRIWRHVWGAFSTMGYARLHHCIKFDHPNWIISEKRVRQIKISGLASGNLRQPSFEVGRDIKPTPERLRRYKERDAAYVSVGKFANAETASVGDLVGRFEVKSGKLAWGQLYGLVAGMKATQLDMPGADREEGSGGTVIKSYGLKFCAPAKKGFWKVAFVEGSGRSTGKTGWLAYHSSHSPGPLVAKARLINFGTRTDNPRITYVNRYDWSTHCSDPGQLDRTLSELNPTIWEAAYQRTRSLRLDGKYVDKYHQDARLWGRLANFGSFQCFLVDGDNAANVIKLVSCRSSFDVRVKKKQASSFFLSNPGGDTDGDVAIGCHLPLHEGEGYEVARLIFDDDEDELIAFWYDNRHWEYYDEELVTEVYVEDV